MVKSHIDVQNAAFSIRQTIRSKCQYPSDEKDKR